MGAKDKRIIAGMLATAAGIALLPMPAEACYYHWALGLPEPQGTWPALPANYPYATGSPTDATSALAQLKAADALDDAAVNASLGGASLGNASIGGASLGNSSIGDDGSSPGAAPAAAPMIQPAGQPAPITDPTITSWMLNTTSTYCYSNNSTIESEVGSILANVQIVAYTSSDVYIKATGLPSYSIGPFPTDPNAPTNQNLTFELPRTPTPAATHTATALGPIGFGVNGVAFFNAWDGNSYQNKGVWQQNANVFEAASFDIGPAHPAPGGTYHYHQEPTALISQVDPANTGQHASPVIGYALDGYPIFGPYGYVVNAQGQVVDGSNGQPEVELMTSSYEENTYAGGVRPNGGPTTSVEPDGSYLQDFTYVAGAGTLDQYNGRFAVAPGYPNGTYGYYVTATYPYIIGPDYYGTVDTNDAMGGHVTVPSGVTYYTPTVPEPAAGIVVIGAATLLRRRRQC